MNDVLYQVRTEVPSNNLAQPQYATSSNLAGSNAATEFQRIIFNALQTPVTAATRQHVETLNQSGVAFGQLRALPDVSLPAPPRRIPCKYCAYICSSEDQWREHVEIHGWVTCDICGKPCRDEAMAAHRQTHAPLRRRAAKRLLCPVCSRVFLREDTFTYHLRAHINHSRAANVNAVVATPTSFPVGLPARPSSTFSVARPLASSLPSPFQVDRPAAFEFPSLEESPLCLDDLDFSYALQFPSEEDKEIFEELWKMMMNELMITHFGGWCPLQNI